MNIVAQLYNLVKRTEVQPEPQPEQTIVNPGDYIYSVCGYVRYSHTDIIDGEMFVFCYREAIPEYQIAARTFMFETSEVFHVNY